MRNFNRDDRKRSTMHQATCSNCNQPCEVPFRPTGEKPVFCHNCFRGKRDNRDYRGGSQDHSRPSQLDEINAKLDRILAALKA